MSYFEDVFFYLDLSKDILKKKEITKAIDYYISEKNKSNVQGHYGLLIFQQLGNPIFITDKKDSSIILNAIEENWKTRPKKGSFFENGCFYIFSYIAESVRKKSKLNRIIIITDTPSDLSEDYTEALFGLVSKIKTFPTFIDIIRVSEGQQRFFTDDVKLNILASDTDGGIFYVSDKKEFLPIIKNLVKSKQTINELEDKPGKIKINKDDYFFYSHLAKKLKPSPLDEVGLKCSLCKEEICPICMEVRDRPLICEECGDSFHNCCITNYTIQNNIGIPHIFRCPKCDILLQIEQDEIVQPFDGEKVSVHDYLEKGNTIKLSSIEEKQNPEIRETCVDKSLEATKFEYEKKESQPNYKENSTIRIGGFFGKVYTVKKEGNKLIYQKTDKHFSNDDDIKNKDALSTSEQQKTPGIKEKSQTWNPAINNNEHIKVKEKFLFTICPECGNRVSNQNKGITKCPNCGYKLNY